MAADYILAIDQGTSNTKAVLVDTAGQIIARASCPLTSSYPQAGWAEQSADAIWQSGRTVIADVMRGRESEKPMGLAIANQRETLIVWDAGTGQPIAPAILWQCRRTADACEALRNKGANDHVAAATGLSINPLFPASKLAWVMNNIAGARSLAAQGRLRAGTVDSWLLYKLTDGQVFATDHSNASRTQLFNTGTLSWDETLGDLFGVPLSALPDPRPSDSLFGHTAEGACALPAGTPILAMMGDSHAALYGHGVRKPGTVKATYGTGSSLMTLSGERLTSRNGLSGTIAWTDRLGTAYALEGNITVSAQAAAFVASLLGLADAQALSELAQTVPSSNGVTFVPALAGLGAPHWNDYATGTLSGMTLATRPAHVARATFEAIALQIADVFNAMEKDAGSRLDALLADGGASTNGFLMHLQADLIQRPVHAGEVAEIGALGVAAMAMNALGHSLSLADEAYTAFVPDPARQEASQAIMQGWQRAIASVLSQAH